MKNDNAYIRLDSQYRSSLYSVGGTRLAGPFDRGLEEVAENLYSYLVSDTLKQYFCIDGAGLYGLAVDARTFVVFDRFGDRVSTVQRGVPDHRDYLSGRDLWPVGGTGGPVQFL